MNDRLNRYLAHDAITSAWTLARIPLTIAAFAIAMMWLSHRWQAASIQQQAQFAQMRAPIHGR